MARLFAVCLVLLAFTMAVAADMAPMMAPMAADMAPMMAPMAAPAADAADCNSDLQDLVANCQNYVMFPAEPKIPPSPACCAVIQRADMPCLCAKVTPAIEKVVCMDKVVFVAKYCKRPLQPGSNCGSYPVPGAFV
ncbi:uncharacterized protein LOC119272194 [Triticum dicoccoides]|uniref:Bifunctional inhibitor/plant lipid transfer protein/seed storage helical domain-containing protein n=2 Tax=Triticum TaxID=4564 RepID=A0A9R0RQQ7_TRITD|nr:uncharacterized protein LOC119272194 [Triticum dicoccoides]XP_044337324.1 uncharacterized protein LOC123058687 [Triticum aestivum]VAH65012.1 unnamed protein product [Triticum turgidum subsp. durum]